MDSIEPISFTDGPSMLIVGVRKRHSAEQAKLGIEAQWEQLKAIPPISSRVGSKRYGVICGGDESGIDFMCGFEVSSFSDLPANLSRMRIPSQHYAVFLHPGTGALLSDTWKAIWNTWLPQSSFTATHGPEFEMYDDANHAAPGGGEVFIWSPVAPNHHIGPDQTASGLAGHPERLALIGTLR